MGEKQQISFNFFDDTPPPESPPEQKQPVVQSAPAALVPPAQVEIVPVEIEIVTVETAPVRDPELPMPKKRGRKPKDPTLVVKKEPGKRGRKSLKEAAAAADLVVLPEDEVLFSKQYYTMGEVAEMFQINHSLIRLWEAQFPILQPKKNKKGDRYFRPVDIKNLYLIHNLIRQRKYTIEGAKTYLKNASKASEKFELIQSLKKVKGFLLEIQANL